MSDLRPFFSYFGGKWTLAPRYPAPEHDLIVEPFAGSAGYATRYPGREIVLVERAPHVAALWRWLIGVSVDEVMGLPLDPREEDDLCEGARTLIRFWCARGRTRTPTTVSSWMTSGRWPSSFRGPDARDPGDVVAAGEWTSSGAGADATPARPARWMGSMHGTPRGFPRPTV